MWVRTVRGGQVLWQVGPWLELTWLRHGFSTAAAGSLLEKYKREAFGCVFEMPAPWVTVRQVHGSEVIWVDEDWQFQDTVEADGLVTRTPGLTLAAFFADCVPLFFVDPNTKTIAVSHAGWRGARAQIASKTVACLLGAGCRVEDIQAAIGPSIGPCCYAVSPDMQDYFPAEMFSENRGQLYLDLWSVNYRQLQEAGVGTVYTAGQCTMCSQEFFSYRRDGTAQRMAAVMAVHSGKGI